jgi:hypothetical protein
MNTDNADKSLRENLADFEKKERNGTTGTLESQSGVLSGSHFVLDPSGSLRSAREESQSGEDH